MNANKNLWAVIMAGGKGRRFWPLSRAALPKQLLPLAGRACLLEATLERVSPLVPPERTYVFTSQETEEKTRRLLTGLPAANIIAEPVGLNTAPCVALAARYIMDQDEDAVLLTLPADHVIALEDEFRRLALMAARLAQKEDVLVTLGIKPSRPETGYGYIEAAQARDDEDEPRPIKAARFHEKPDFGRAIQYLASGKHYYNSGMFIWRASVILAAIARHQPGMAQTLAGLKRLNPENLAAALGAFYSQVQPISIDYAVMEKADNVWVIPAQIGWSDVGSWSSAGEFWPRLEGNRARCKDAVFIETQGCVVHAPGKTVALIGLEDLVIVDTPDAILVAPRDRDQELGRVIEALEKKNRTDLL